MVKNRVLQVGASALSHRWPVCFGVVFALCAAADRYLGGGIGLGVLWAFGAGAGAGLVFGWASGAVAQSLGAKRAYVTVLPWVSFGTLVAWRLSLDLGLWSRFDGEYKSLAWFGLVGCSSIVVLGGALGWFLAPRLDYPNGWLLTKRVWLRALGCVALFVAGALMIAVDRRVEPLGYPMAHDTLRGGAVICLASALWLALWSVMNKAACGWSQLALLLGFAPLFALTPRFEDEIAALQRRPFSAFALSQVRLLSDPDLDGHSSLFGGIDCGPFNSAVNPGVEEVPGNGVDDNCRRGDALKRTADSATIAIPADPAPMSVVLITVDSLSALRMNLFGAKRPTTPKLNEWAKGAVVFDRAYTSGGWTSLAISSLFRGTYPRRLTWTRVLETNLTNLLRVNEPVPKGETARRSFGLPLDESREPLAWWLQRRGMFTAAVANDRQSEFLDPRFVGKGFDEFVDLDYGGRGKADDTAVTDAALRVLERLPNDRPAFLWVHYFGPHKPDEFHKGVTKFGNTVADRYDHEVLFNDGEVARFLSALDATSWGPNASVFIAADHGERIQGEWRGHGMDVHEGTLRIPLVMRAPGYAGKRVSIPVSLVDVMPTIMALTNTPAPPMDGVDLREVVKGAVRKRMLVADTWRFNAQGEVTRDETAVFDGKSKLEFGHTTQSSTAFSQRPERRLPKVPATADFRSLQDALDQYIEENGAVHIHD